MAIQSNPELEVVELPWFLDIVEEFRAAWEHKLHKEARRVGMLSQIKSHVVHEGRKSHIVRKADEEAFEMKKMSTEFEVPFDRINRFLEDDAEQLINKMAQLQRDKLERQVIETLDKVTEKTGNVIHAQGQPLSVDMLLKVLDSLPLDFETPDQFSPLVAVVSPAMMARVNEMKVALNNDAELQRRYKELRIRKYEQHRDREMDRTLAG